jgi:hypothetical protein
MNILSNFTPDCIVRAEVSCKMEDLKDDSGISLKNLLQNSNRLLPLLKLNLSVQLLTIKEL